MRKRKTHTSAEVKARYTKKTYDGFLVRVRKEHAAAFRAAIARTGDTAASVFHKAIREYVEKNGAAHEANASGEGERDKKK
jgi:hypothetical protein